MEKKRTGMLLADLKKTLALNFYVSTTMIKWTVSKCLDLLIVSIILSIPLSAVAKESVDAKGLYKKTNLHISQIFRTGNHLVKWDFPVVYYITYLYGAPKPGFTIPRRIDAKIDQYFTKIEKNTQIRFQRVKKMPKRNSGIIVLAFSNRFYNTIEKAPNIKRVFWGSLQSQYRDWEDYVIHLKEKKIKGISKLVYDQKKVRFYISIADLSEDIADLKVNIFQALCNASSSDVYIPSISNSNAIELKIDYQKIDFYILKSMYSDGIFHGMDKSHAITLISERVANLLKAEQH